MKIKNRFSLFHIVFFIVIIVAFLIWTKYDQVRVYKEADAAMESEDYESAIEKYQALGNYKDSAQKLAEAQNIKNYNMAVNLYNDGKYEEAGKLFDELGDYKDSKKYLMLCSMSDYNTLQGDIYDEALNNMNEEKYFEAKEKFTQIGEYKDSKEMTNACDMEIWRRCLASTISAGSVTSLAIDNTELKTTGRFEFGQDALDRDNLLSISTGVYYTVGLYKDGKAKVAGNIAWYNDLKMREVNHVIKGVAAADYVVFLKEDGTVCGDGYDSEKVYGERIDFTDWNNIIDIDAGYHLVAGVDKNGKVYVTGRNATAIREEIDTRKDEWMNVYRIAVGGGDAKDDGFIVGLRKDHTVVVAGNCLSGVKEAETWTDIKDISAGDYHVVGLKKSGEVVGCININSKTDTWAAKTCCDFSKWNDVHFVSVEAGNCTTLCVSEDGTVYSCGYDHGKQIPESMEWKNILVYSNYSMYDFIYGIDH